MRFLDKQVVFISIGSQVAGFRGVSSYDILKKYPSLVKQEQRKYDADPWVIALAIELSTSSQKTLSPVKRIVVTEEKLRGNKVKIPYVCQIFNIESISIIEMFRAEGWKF